MFHLYSRAARFASSVSLAAIAAIVLLPADAQAQTGPSQASPLPTREELNPDRRPAAAPVRAGDPFLAPVRGSCPFVDSDLRFTLRDVAFRGATALTSEALKKSYRDLLGKEVPVAAVCEIRDRVAELFFREGILARVEIPQQSITDGRLTIEVIEAHIAEANVTGDVGPVRRQVEAYVARARTGGVFDLDRVQRYLLLASDIPGIRIATTLRPVEGMRGAVALDVAVTRIGVEAVTSAQNLGSRTTGRWNVLGKIDVNGLTALGERTSLAAYVSGDLREQRLFQFVEEARLGSDGLVGRLSLSHATGRPGGFFRDLGINTRSLVGNAELSYPIVRRRRENLSISEGFEWVDQQTRLNDLPLSDESLRIFYARLQGNVAAPIGRVPMVAGASFEVRKGLDFAGATKADFDELLRVDPQAAVFRLGLFAQAQLTPRLSLSIRTEAQTSDAPLMSYEKLNAGNFTIGRGYDPGVISGDRGVASSFEASYGPFGTPWLSASLFGFVDTARVDNFDLDAGLPGYSASVRSAGGGLRTVIDGRVSLDATMAFPLRAPFAGFGKPGPRLLVNLTTRIR